MAVRRLINMINGIAVNKNVALIRGDASVGARQDTISDAFIFRARVESVTQDTIQVSTINGSEGASLATDEPFQPGQMVWVLRADDGSLVVLGGA